MRILLAVLALALLPATAHAAPQLDRIGSFDSPVYVASPPGDARLFVVERGGAIRIVGKDGAVRPQFFADLSAHTTTDGERGLLSLAFPADYAQSGLAYVYVTARDGELQVRELRRSADPNRAEPGAGRLVIGQAHAQFNNHNGGQVAFGPDGFLYAGTGDGGASNDPNGNGQRLSTLLGKLIRIDPRATPDGRPYSVPADNPFVGRADARPEIWAYGIRNAFRFSFDRSAGDLWIGDVGQGAREEVDFAPRGSGLGRGANYGWRCYEGSIRTPGITPCEAPGHVPPLFDLDHDADGVCSITGGVVVRDPGLPTLRGRYVHADLCDQRIRSADTSGAKSVPTGMTGSTLVAFGEDACGRVYPVSLEGPVYRIRDGAATACDLPEAPGSGATPGPGTGATVPPAGGAARDRTPCRIAIRRRSRQRVRALRLAVTTSERCTVRATLRIRGVGTLRSRTRTLAAGRRSTLKLASTAKVRRAVARRPRTATLVVSARDAAGNASRATRRVRVVR